MRRCDVFCKVVDNLGDIGVSWRLVRQLATEYGWKVRLWVDDIRLAHRFADFVETDIEIVHWHAETDFSQAAEVIIETFSCGLPPAYQQAMLAQHSAWINVEYLSAEDWVADFHGKPSPQANGLIRHFFYPGFTTETGGLIRERDLTTKQAQASQQMDAFWQQLGVNTVPHAKKISLFCYPHAPTRILLEALAQHPTPMYCLVPESVGKACDITSGVYGACTVHRVPFLSQDDYDRLLWACDLNFVRGEDSCARAIWAGKPFIWQPYLQAENAHMTKLHAFLERFYSNSAYKDMLWKAHEYWVAGQGDSAILYEYLQQLPSLQSDVRQHSAALAAQTDLATNLVIYIEKLNQTRV